MKRVIGLFEREQAVSPAVERLKNAGIAGEEIQIVSNTNTVTELLGCDPACVIKNYTAWGVAIGVGIYAVFGLAAALCECGLMQFGREYGVGVFIGALLAGTLVGSAIGFLVGAGEAEKDTHLYVQGIRTGGKVIAIRVPDPDSDRVKNLLLMEHALGVKALLGERT